MAVETCGERAGALGLAGDAHVQGLEPTQEQPGDVGGCDRPGSRSELTQPFGGLGIADH